MQIVERHRFLRLSAKERHVGMKEDLTGRNVVMGLQHTFVMFGGIALNVILRPKDLTQAEG